MCDRLRHQDPAPVRRHEERRCDGSVPVLPGGPHYAQDERDQAGDADVAQERAPVVLTDGVARRQRDHDDQHRQRDRDEAQPPEGARCPELEELGGDQRAHATSPSVSRVSSRKTSSSEGSARSATSSWSVIPFWAASSPTCSGGRSPTVSSPGCTCVAAGPRSSASRSACGLRTRTVALPAPRAVSPVSVECARRRPRWITTTSSTVCETSERTWLDTRIVRPSAASERRKSRSQRIP